MPNKKYQNNAGVIGVTRVAKGYDDATIYGNEPDGAALGGVYFYKSGSRRRPGSQVRYVIAERNDGPVTPSGSQPKLFAHATVGTQAAFNGLSPGDQIDLPGGTYTITSKKDEG